MALPNQPARQSVFQERNYAKSSGYLSVLPNKSRSRHHPLRVVAVRGVQGDGIKNLVEETEPPYKNALLAMRDGWQVIQMSEMKHRSADDGYELGPLPYQTVLSRFSELQDKEEGS